MTDSAKDRLLADVMDYVTAHGFAGFSLRSVATEIGTSHRMLIHHFGSKAGLESAVVGEATRLLTQPFVALAEQDAAGSLPCTSCGRHCLPPNWNHS